MSGPIEFDPEWRITLFTVILVPLMASLGFWQLQRAEEKALLAADWEVRQRQAPVPLGQLVGKSPDDIAYQRVALSGTVSGEEYFLLDNKIRQGRFGYEVLAVLHGGEQQVLVNRGWIEADPARRSLPQVPALDGRLEWTGHVYVSPGEPYLLAEQQLSEGWPKLIQAVEMEKIQPILGGDVFPYPVRLEAEQPGALVTDWLIVNVSPGKHRGYAVQWFSMAVVLLIFYLLRCSNLWQVISGRTEKEENQAVD